MERMLRIRDPLQRTIEHTRLLVSRSKHKFDPSKDVIDQFSKYQPISLASLLNTTLALIVSYSVIVANDTFERTFRSLLPNIQAQCDTRPIQRQRNVAVRPQPPIVSRLSKYSGPWILYCVMRSLIPITLCLSPGLMDYSMNEGGW